MKLDHRRETDLNDHRRSVMYSTELLSLSACRSMVSVVMFCFCFVFVFLGGGGGRYVNKKGNKTQRKCKFFISFSCYDFVEVFV